VLGAGGVRGCAHAAVIAVLREAGIPIDLVVGASAGALFGLGVAAGLPTERIVPPVLEATPLDLFRFYAGGLRPRPSNPIARLMLEAGDGKDFSDLLIPFAVLATDVATGQPTVLNRGPVLPAVQASIALPFIARPVSLEERVYVDGGLFDTAPVGPARRMGADRVIAVCLGHNYTAPAFLRRRPWTRGMLERLGRQPRPPSARLRDQLRFSCRLYAATYNPPPPAQDADIVIWPEFGRVGPNSMFGAQFCFEQGMQAIRAALPEIEKVLSL
jgi:NTE family protein